MRMKPVFFESPAAFREWLAAHHDEETELWVGYHRKATGRPSLTWPESVDEALCFGWIDGVRRSVDAERYAIRFTPRRPGSNWSLVNVGRVAALRAAGRMTPAGTRAFEARRPDRTGVYSFESRPADLPAEALARMRRVKGALAFWSAQPPGYRRTAAFWVTSAKREETRSKRLDELIACCARGERIAQLRRDPAK